MAVPLFTNNATGTLAGSYSSGATAITLTAGQGAKFPSPSGGDYFMLTIVDNLNNIEIVKVTAKATDTFTVVRGQEGTAARALGAGEIVGLRVTAGALDALKNKVQQTADIADGAVTTPKLAANAVDGTKLADGAINTAAKIADAVITSAKLAVGVALANLGYTPVQQGGGVGQTTDKVYIGWTVLGKLALTVGITDLGYLLTQRDDGSAASGGFRGAPVVLLNSDSALGLSHASKALYHSAGTHTYTVPADATAFDPGTVILIYNRGGTLSITPAGGVTLEWIGSGATGARTLATKGKAVLTKLDSNLWVIEGTNRT